MGGNSKKRILVEAKYSGYDIFMEIISAISLILLLGLVFYYWNSLPHTIITHFNVSGKPDGFGSKYSLLLFISISLVLYTILTLISRYPHIYNYPVPITEANAAFQYRTAASAIRLLKMIVMIFFTYIQITVIRSSIGPANGLSAFPIVVFVVLLLGAVLFFIRKSIKHSNKMEKI